MAREGVRACHEPAGRPAHRRRGHDRRDGRRQGGGLSALLVGVTPRDLLSLAGSVAVLPLTASVASYLPARRASRIDPPCELR